MQSPPYYQGDRVSYFLYKKPDQNDFLTNLNKMSKALST